MLSRNSRRARRAAVTRVVAVLTACVMVGSSGPAAAEVVTEIDVLNTDVSAVDTTAGVAVDEVTEGWTEFSHWWTNPDGTRTLQTATRPVNYQDATGEWRAVDLSLATVGGMLRPVAGPDSLPTLSPLSAPATAFLSVAGGQIVVSYEGASAVAGTPLGTAGLRYPAVLSGGRDLEVSLTLTGYKDQVTVPARSAGTSYRVVFDVPAGYTVEDAGPAVRFVGPDGTEVGRYGGGIAWDSSTAGSEAPVTARVVGRSANTVTVEVAPPQAWADDPARDFPVVVDPSYTSSYYTGDSGGFDTYVNNDNKSLTYPVVGGGTYYYLQNHLRTGSSGFCEEGTGGAGQPACVKNIMRSFLKFPLPIPTDATVNAARLAVYNVYSHTGVSDTTYVYGLASSPTSSTTWNNQPWLDSYGLQSSGTFAYGATSTSGSPCADGQPPQPSVNTCGGWWWEFTGLAPMVRRWQAGSNYGMALKGGTTEPTERQDMNAYRKFYSAQADIRGYTPQMIIDYSVSTAAPSISSSTHTSGTCSNNNDPSFTVTSGRTTSTQWSYLLTQDSTAAPDTTAETTTSSGTLTHNLSNVSDGTWYYKVRYNTSAGWSSTASFTLRIDTQKPTINTLSSSTHLSQDAWSTNNQPKFAWTASDTGCGGVNGYSYQLATTPGGLDYTFDGNVVSYDSPAVADGTWYFKVRPRDGAGNWGDAVEYRVRIDATAPPAPPVSASAPHNDPLVWSRDNTVELSWPTTDTSGILGYLWLIDQQSASQPTIATTDMSMTTAPLPDGVSYFHVAAQNGAGLWGTSAHFAMRIDATAPNPVTGLKQTSCQEVGIASSARAISLKWDASTDVTSGLAGYHWVLNGSATVPATDTDPFVGAATTSLTTEAPGNGTYFFHVRAKDKAGNLGTDAVLGPFVVDSSAAACLSDLLRGFVAQSDELGLEQFYAYDDHALGGIATAFVNLGNGNLVTTVDDVRIPGLGLNTAVRHVYNSNRTTGDTGMAAGWSLSVTDADVGLDADGIDLGDPNLSINPANVLDDLGQLIGAVIEFTDGDGTTHRFARQGLPGARWQSPPGVDLKVDEVLDPVTQLPVAYDFVRPDGVVYRAEQLPLTDVLPTWRVVSVTDRRNNTLTYDYAAFGSPIGVARLVAVRHSGIADPVVTFSYDTSARLTRITSLPGVTAPDASGAGRSWERWVSFSYDANGRLGSTTENDHLAGGDSGRRVTTYGYGADGALATVTDAKGKKTTFVHDSVAGQRRVRSVSDRRSKVTAYDYGVINAATQAPSTKRTSPLGAVTYFDISAHDQTTTKGRSGANVTAITDPGSGAGSNTTRFTWLDNRLTRRTDATAAEWSYTYTDLGQVATLTEPRPNDASRTDLPAGAPVVPIVTRLTYAYPGGNAYAGCAPDPVIGTDGHCATHADLVRVSKADDSGQARRITDFHYDGSGNGNVGMRIERGPTTSTTDPEGARPAISDAPRAGVDRATTFTYDDTGRELRSADGPRTDVSDTTAYAGYDRTGRPTTVTDAANKTTALLHSPYGEVLRVTDRDGRVTTSAFDERGNRTRAVEPDGDAWSWRYDPGDNVVAMTTPRGNATATVDDYTTLATYDDAENLIEISEPGATAADPRRISTFSYDDTGRRASATTPKGAATNYTWWPNDLLASIDAPAGSTTQRALTERSYDPAGRLRLVTLPVANAAGERPSVTITYTPSGAEAARTETAAHGQVALTRFAYSPHGEVIQTLGPRSASDATGTLSAESTHAYDAFGAETQRRRRADRATWLTTTFAYDEAGNRKELTQPGPATDTLTWTYGYDALNRIATSNDPTSASRLTTFTYDNEGNQLARIDTVDSVVHRKTESHYNPDGSIQRRVATAGGATLAECNFAAGAAPTSGYDADGHPLASRTLSGTTDCTGGTLIGSETFTWDDRGWMSSSTQTVAPPGQAQVTRAQAFSYDADGARATFTHNGKAVTYGRSPAGWVTSIADFHGATSTASYFPSGAVATETRGGTISATRGYFADRSLSSLTWSAAGTTLRSHSNFTYDTGGLKTAEGVNILAPGASTATGGDATLSYDLAGRLTSWRSPYLGVGGRLRTAYTLDEASNVTRELVTDDAGAMRSDSRYNYSTGRLTTKNTEKPGLLLLPGEVTCESFGYTPLGEEQSRTEVVSSLGSAALGCGLATSTTTGTTTYDPAGYVDATDVDGTGPEPALDYAYDLDDSVLVRAEGTEKTLYFYDPGTGRLVEEANAAGEAIVTYLLDGDGSPVAHETHRSPNGSRNATPTWVWLLDDSEGNVATHVLDAGEVLEQASYQPYGRKDNAGSPTKANGYAGSSLGYQSDLTDPKTNKLLLGPRQYDPSTLRFSTPDTYAAADLDLALGVDELTGNRYVFAASNPVAFYEDGHGCRNKSTHTIYWEVVGDTVIYVGKTCDFDRRRSQWQNHPDPTKRRTIGQMPPAMVRGNGRLSPQQARFWEQYYIEQYGMRNPEAARFTKLSGTLENRRNAIAPDSPLYKNYLQWKANIEGARVQPRGPSGGGIGGGGYNANGYGGAGGGAGSRKYR